MAKKLSITDILAQKEALKKRSSELKRQTLHVPSLGAEITIQQPTRAQLLELKDMEEDGNDYLVYQCTVEPDLKTNRAQLMTEFDCVEPHEIVRHLFTIQETADITDAILGLAGIYPKKGSGVKVVDEIKN